MAPASLYPSATSGPVGAGTVPVCGEMSTMPALPTVPQRWTLMDDNGNIVGLF